MLVSVGFPVHLTCKKWDSMYVLQTVKRARIGRRFLLRVVLLATLGVSVLYCLRHTYSQTTLLCTRQDLTYSRTEAFSVSDASKLQYSQLLQDILRSYQHYHAVKRRELAAGKTSRTLTWYCLSRCGGIGDRAKGMYAAFLLALVTNRTFFIHLSDEVQTTMFLEPSAIDWRPVDPCVELNPDQTLDNFGRTVNYVVRAFFGITNNVSVELNRIKMIDSVYISNKLRIITLIHYIISEMSSDLNPLHLRLLQLVKKSGEGGSLHSFLSELHHFLFRLPEKVREMAHSALAELRLKPRGFVTVHIRTGFKNSLVGEIPFTTKFLKGTRFARSKDSWRRMIDCGIHISDSKFGGNRTILVVSDDLEPKNWAASEYKSRVTMLDIKPVHVVAIVPSMGSFKVQSRDEYLDTWVELSVMAQSSAIVGIHSGYSEVATHIGSLDPSSVYIYDLVNKTCTKI